MGRTLTVSRRFGMDSLPSPMQLRVWNVMGITMYDRCLRFQRQRRERKYDELRTSRGGEEGENQRSSSVREADDLILVEHESVYTLGRGASMDNILFDVANERYKLRKVERGGEVTWHGPGQIVGYTIFDLRKHRKDLHWYLREIEQIIIDVLHLYGLEGCRHDEYTGVWVGDAKVAAIGLSASRWITMHGFALNVDPDLDAFNAIVPCGIDLKEKSVTSMQKLLKQDSNLDQAQIRRQLVHGFLNRFAFEQVHYHTSFDAGPVASFNIKRPSP